MVGAEGVCHHCVLWGETLEKWRREEGRGGDVCEPWEACKLLSLFTQAWSGLLLSAPVRVPTLPRSQGIYNYPPATSLGGSLPWVRCQTIDRLLTEALQVFYVRSEVFPSILSTLPRPVAVLPSAVARVSAWQSCSTGNTTKTSIPAACWGLIFHRVSPRTSKQHILFFIQQELGFAFQYSALAWRYWQVWELHRWGTVAAL